MQLGNTVYQTQVPRSTYPQVVEGAQKDPSELARLELSALSARLGTLNSVEWSRAVTLIGQLNSDYPEQCKNAHDRICEQLLERMASCVQRTLPQELGQRGLKLGLDESLMKLCVEPGLLSRAWDYARTGASFVKRRQQQFRVALEALRFELRQRGEPTLFSGLPSASDIKELRLNPELLKQTAPSPAVFEAGADILQLHRWLIDAQDAGLLPEIFRESITDKHTTEHPQKEHLKHIKEVLERIAKAGEENARLYPTQQKLMHYTADVQRRLDLANTPALRREIYLELVEWVGHAVAFAGYHCEDGLFRAAEALWQECCSEKLLAELSTSARLKVWAATKRDQLFDQIVYEMIVQRSRELERPLDVASGITTWRYIFRKDFGLSAAAEPQWWVEAELKASDIRERFEQCYLADYLLDEAWREFKEPDGAEFMRYSALTDYLCARFEDTDLVREACVDQTWALKREAVAFYLIEAGVLIKARQC